MTPPFRSSRPHESIVPRQRRWNDFGHGKIVPMDSPDGEPSLIVGIMITAFGLFVIAALFGLVL